MIAVESAGILMLISLVCGGIIGALWYEEQFGDDE